MSESLTGLLAGAAVTLGSLHTLAPDHWVPFAALARAQGWSRGRTARITALCGFGHVSVSALLGVLALFFGLEVLRLVGQRMEAVAGILLIVFGLVYAAYGLRRAAGRACTATITSTTITCTSPAKMTPWALFLLFSADPCVAVIPILFAAAPLGALRRPCRRCLRGGDDRDDGGAGAAGAAAAKRVTGHWVEHYGDAAAGAIIAGVGVFVAALGW